MSRKATIDTARHEKEQLQREYRSMENEKNCAFIERRRIERKVEELERRKVELLASNEVLTAQKSEVDEHVNRMYDVEETLRKQTEDAVKLGKRLCSGYGYQRSYDN